MWIGCFSLPGIYDDDPEIITLDRGEFGKLLRSHGFLSFLIKFIQGVALDDIIFSRGCSVPNRVAMTMCLTFKESVFSCTLRII